MFGSIQKGGDPKSVKATFFYYLSLDEARQRNEKTPNTSISVNKADDGDTSKDSNAKADLETERLSLGFPDEEEAIQLGLIVPDDSLESSSNLIENQSPRFIQKQNFNVNKKQQVESSDVDIVELKNYTQVDDYSTKNIKRDSLKSSVPNKPSNAFHESNSEQSSFDLKEIHSEEKEMPPLANNTSSKQSFSSPNTSCSPQSDKLNNAEDKMNEDVVGKEVWEEGIIVNPSCYQDKLLSGYCRNSPKNINEVPKNVKHWHYIKNGYVYNYDSNII